MGSRLAPMGEQAKCLGITRGVLGGGCASRSVPVGRGQVLVR